MNFAHMLEWSARRHGPRPAVVFEGQELTFDEVDDRATRLAGALQGLGVQKGDRVGILIANQLEYLECESAVAKAGAARVPMLIRSSVAEISYYLTASEAVAVIASEQCLPVLREALRDAGREDDVTVIAIGGAEGDEVDYGALVAAPASAFDRPDVLADDLYAIRFTGGTTGRPKGVAMSHRTMNAVVQNMLLNWPVSPDDVVCHIHPLSHACGMIMYPWHVRGAKQIVLPAFGFRPEALLETIERDRVTTMFMIPTVLNIVLDSELLEGYDVSSVHSIIYGGAPIPVQRIKEGLEAFGQSFIQIYGSSEAPNILTTLLPEEHTLEGDGAARRLGSAGRVGLGVEVKVVDQGGEECEVGEVGEIVSRGPHTMTHYWRDPELTADRMRDGWVYTRDMGSFDEDGYLTIVDRKDDMIITGGFNVWPAEIEEEIYRHPKVREAAVFGVEDRKWGEAVVAAVYARPGEQLDEQELRDYLADKIAKHKVPKAVWLRDEPLPTSAADKLLRRRTKDEYLATQVGG